MALVKLGQEQSQAPSEGAPSPEGHSALAPSLWLCSQTSGPWQGGSPLLPVQVADRLFGEGLGLALGAPSYTHTDGRLVLSWPSCLLSLAREALVGSLLLHPPFPPRVHIPARRSGRK